MSMTSTAANKLNNAIASAFGKIGDTNGTRMPQIDNNREPHVWEFYVASTLERIAKRRKENAEKELVKLGVMFDPAIAPRPNGARETLFVGDNVMVNLTVGVNAFRLDEKLFATELLKAGVALDVIERARANSMKPSRAPHTFSASLISTQD